MEMVESDAPDEAVRWRLQSEVEASWGELQGAKVVSRALQASAPSPAAKPAAGQAAAPNRGARRAAARNQLAPAAVDGIPAVAPANSVAIISAQTAATGSVQNVVTGAGSAPLVQSFGVGLPARPKRSSTK
jgi:hypothetical protein